MVYVRFYKFVQFNGVVVEFVYGVGYFQNVYYYWSYYQWEMFFYQLFVVEGYIVFDVDYCVSEGYGCDFWMVIYWYMGNCDFEDFRDVWCLLIV